jgi:hypothetical protein
MSAARAGSVGATRICPHCKATVLESATICPGCKHHLRFNAAPSAAGYSALRVEGAIQHRGREQCEYCVIVSINNELGEKLVRQVVGVGAMQPGQRHTYSFSVELIPVGSPVATPAGVRRRI